MEPEPEPDPSPLHIRPSFLPTYLRCSSLAKASSALGFLVGRHIEETARKEGGEGVVLLASLAVLCSTARFFATPIPPATASVWLSHPVHTKSSIRKSHSLFLPTYLSLPTSTMLFTGQRPVPYM